MGRNLPPGAANDPRAPWNEPEPPEPRGYCPHDGCRAPYGYNRSERINLDETMLRYVIHEKCPNCGEVVEARGVDESEHFNEAWRNAPNMMAGTIERYHELREIAETLRHSKADLGGAHR